MAQRIIKAISSKSAAKQWIERGIKVIPIKKGTKKPDAGDDWQDLRIKASQIEDYFSPSNGVGGLWGEPSKWAIDVDLDCKEAVRAARVILPKTFRYGRHDNPGSHYIYTCAGSKTVKWYDPETRGMIVELRSTGSQSLLPPTIHPSGDRFAIERDLPFEKIGFRELTNCLNQLAAVALAAKYYPEEHGRHDFVHAWTGSLMRTGISKEHVEKLGTALLTAVGSIEDERSQRERTIKNTIAKHDESKTAGWKTLKEFIPAKAVEKIQGWLKSKSNGHDSEDEPPAIVANRGDEYDPIPKDLLEMDGIIAQVMRWSRMSSHVKQPLFDLATGFFCTALASKNRYVVSAWNTPLQPYFMLLAPTSGGKDSALNSVYEFAKGRHMEDRVVAGIQSWYALVDKLSNPPHQVAWVWDEAARKLQAAGRSSGSPEHSVITWMLSAYGRANRSTPAIPGRNITIPAIDHPFLITMAAAQPKALVEAASGADLTTGTLNRFVLFDAGTGGGLNHERDHSLRGVGKQWVEKVVEVQENSFYGIDMDGATYKAMKAFADHCYAEATSEKDDFSSLWGRAHQNACILAGLIAISRDPARPKITSDAADWAIRFMKWSTGRWLARLGGQVAKDSLDSKFIRVERHIKNAKQMAGRARNDSEKTLAEKGFMHYSFLRRLCRLDARTFESAIEMLVDAGTIATGEKDGQTVYWAK